MPATAKKYGGVVDENGWTGKLSELDLSVFDKLPKKTARVFVGSMTDLFFMGKNDTGTQSLHCRIAKILAKIEEHKQHTFIILTKRPEEMCDILSSLLEKPLHNLWVGVTVCNQQEADEKIPLLLRTPAAKRFVSIEPMLDMINLNKDMLVYEHKELGELAFANPLTGAWYCEHQEGGVQEGLLDGLDWVICGCETGQGARPMHISWAMSLRDQCQETNVPFFLKSIIEDGKKTRLIDGREWNGVPK